MSTKTTIDSSLVFKKSSFSGRGPRCVSVARVSKSVLVKHSLNEKPILTFSRGEWEAFIQGVKAGEFDLFK